MSYDLVGEIVKYLQIRQQFWEERLVAKEESYQKIERLYVSESSFKHLIGSMLCFYADWLRSEMSELRQRISCYVQAVADLKQAKYDTAIQVLEKLENYFAFGPEQGILLTIGPSGTQFEKVQEFLQQLKALQDEKQKKLLQIS